MKLGMDATDGSQTPEQIKKIMKYGIPVITLVATSTFPSALCLYWFTSNIISVAQGALLRMPAVKNATGVGEFKVWDDADLPMKNISIFDHAFAMSSFYTLFGFEFNYTATLFYIYSTFLINSRSEEIHITIIQ